MPKPKCFVIRSLHKRSDYVLAHYVLPAYEDLYDVIWAVSEPKRLAITEDVFQHLRDDSLVVMYLDSPARTESEGQKWFWSPDIILEAGYRLGLGLPIVFIREHRRSEDEPLLPVDDLFDENVIELPTEEEQNQSLFRERTISKLKAFVAVGRADVSMPTAVHYAYAHPAITMVFSTGGSKVVAASDNAAALLGFPDTQSLIEMPVATLVDKISSRLSPQQRAAFHKEQDGMLGEISNGKKPMATVPLVFVDQNISPSGTISAAYLPIISRYSTTNDAVTTEVFYLDVTASSWMGNDGVVRCSPRPPLTPSHVEFSVCYPGRITANTWYTLLVYVHVPEAKMAVQNHSAVTLGGEREKAYLTVGRSTVDVTRGSEIRVVPEFPGCRVNPPSATLFWLEDWHCVEFRLKWETVVIPDIAELLNGRVAFYVGPILVSEVTVSIQCSTQAQTNLYEPPVTATSVGYQAIFVSYSHHDSEIVDQLEKAYSALGMQYLRDIRILRSGEQWNSALLGKIEEADIFQLCWSSAAKNSQHVTQEWRHAMAQKRTSFVRPMYWQTSMPDPPPELSDLHFAYLSLI